MNNQSKEKSIHENLKKIYQDSSGNMPEMGRLEYGNKNRWTKTLIISGLLLAAIVATAWSGFFWYDSKPSFTGERISLDISSPFSVITGDKVNYTISITNNEDVAINNSKIHVRFPLGYLLKSSSIESIKDEGLFTVRDSNSYQFKVGEIKPQSNFELVISGQLISELDVRPTISVKLVYSPENYSSSFEKNTTFSADVIDSVSAVTIAYKNQVIDAEDVLLDIAVKNVGEVFTLENSRLDLDLPESFKIQSFAYSTFNELSSEENEGEKEEYINFTDQELEDLIDNNFISLGSISQKQTQRFKLVGIFMVDKNLVEKLTLNFMQQDVRGNYIIQAREQAEFQVVKGEVLATMIINGSTNNSAVNFGTVIPYLISIKNKSSSALGDVKVRAVIDSAIIDYTSLNDPAKGSTSVNQILWTKDQIPALNLMLPEDEVIINFNYKTKTFEAVKNLAFERLKISSFAEVTVGSIDSLAVNKKTESNSVINNVNTDASIATVIKYFAEDGVAVGSGPIPPQVGQKTVYQVIWTLANSLHELENIKISTTLPSEVSWEMHSSSESGSVELVGDQVVWLINRLPTSVNTLTATFDISVTPQEKDINKLLTLLGETILTAKDKETSAEITASNSPQTNKVEGDSSGLVKP